MRTPSPGLPVVAKVSDFGLSLRLSDGQDQIMNVSCACGAARCGATCCVLVQCRPVLCCAVQYGTTQVSQSCVANPAFHPALSAAWL